MFENTPICRRKCCDSGFVVKMEAEWTDADIVRLISMYEGHACLYDPADVNYRNRDAKRMKESEVAAALAKIW